MRPLHAFSGVRSREPKPAPKYLHQDPNRLAAANGAVPARIAHKGIERPARPCSQKRETTPQRLNTGTRRANIGSKTNARDQDHRTCNQPGVQRTRRARGRPSPRPSNSKPQSQRDSGSKRFFNDWKPGRGKVRPPRRSQIGHLSTSKSRNSHLAISFFATPNLPSCRRCRSF